jgi:hypothetical protein
LTVEGRRHLRVWARTDTRAEDLGAHAPGDVRAH